MAAHSAWLGGTIFLVAGAYQWLPIKNACLTHCRSPLGFLTREWREGRAGAFIMGSRHGLFCVGCCWALMALLFAAGVMNLFWVAAIAAFVLVEKLMRQGPRVGRLAGTLLIVWGAYVLARGG
jgi:predicted metal-binding membrane protein